ncbi:MAG TPA: PA14 domain-containing protein, partial [Chitinophagaceae bacterium]|nr:PA14 domain-containing protein [Chitinophagaceae bacterium]
EGADTLLALPAYGYLHYTEGARNKSALLDFNREKELTFREKPATPHIAIPVYTYDAFSITGEGTGGSFRAYRSDIGFVYDHFIRTKDESDRFSGDIGLGDLVHGGIDLNVNRAYTQNGPWITENALKNTIAFKDSGALFEPVYFRNPGEKSINSKQFYEALGGDDVVSVDLYQPGIGSSFIQATNYLTRYRNKRAAGKLLLTPQNAIKTERDKRTQVISYLTAKQAGVAGLSKYIENHNMNVFSFENCAATELPEPPGTGLPAEYYKNTTLSGTPATRIDPVINFNLKRNSPYPEAGIPADQFSVRWKGRLLAPVTGAYQIIADSTDDGVRLWLNDSLFIDQWCDDCHPTGYTANVNLLAGEYYDIKVEFKDNKRDASLQLKWIHPNQPVKTLISQGYLYGPPVDTIRGNSLTREKRINSFRKEHHISEVDVLNSDGRRYVYGIPVYNFKQREATFAVDGKTRGNRNSGLVGYTHGQDNTSNNRNGKDWYYNSEEMPAYTHSFLLTGILSTDYVDATGNGISDDDPGDAIKFNYSKIRGVKNPYRWRAPYNDSTTYNEGLRTDHRDDKGNYVYGEKELWYLHSIESRTMVATFTLEDRLDLPAIDEAGTKYQDGSAKRLKQINLYTKADLKKNGSKAKPVKTVHFEYSYELCKGVNKPLTDSGKLTLKKIWFSYNGNKKGAQNPYVFNYNAKNPDHNIKSYDRWGNYKDALENPGSSVGNLISNAEHPYALQDSIKAARNAAAWALDSIRLPSGGAIKVTYESDDYAFVQNKRAMQVFKILGLSSGTNYGSASNKLYTPGGDNLYVFVSVPHAVADNEDVYHKYLSGINKLFFRLSVRMPADQYGNGYEYVTCYADLDAGNAYGRVSSNVIWIKLAGISLKGDGGGSYSPLAKAAIQFLRLNLPSKAYPGSEVGDNIDVEEAVKMLASLKNNITNAI